MLGLAKVVDLRVQGLGEGSAGKEGSWVPPGFRD